MAVQMGRYLPCAVNQEIFLGQNHGHSAAMDWGALLCFTVVCD